jgi:hypothetical protein
LGTRVFAMAHDGHGPCAYFFPTLNFYGDSEFEFVVPAQPWILHPFGPVERWRLPCFIKW